MGKRYFKPDIFRFLEDLEENNNRDWFKANQERYETSVREPALEFINDFAKPLKKVSPHLVANAKKVGGSLFRIQKDTRFSKDKSPYKTNTGVQFRHEAGKDAHCPGIYLHIEPGQSMMAVGIWRPDSPSTAAIRAAMVDDPSGWKRASRSKAFAEKFELEGDSLKRPPRGIDPEHALITDLKRKDFIGMSKVSRSTITSDKFMDEFEALCKRAKPMLGWLAGALELEF